MTSDFKYIFSYGSNLLFERINARVDTVEVMCKYELKGYELVFNKLSNDGSAKANLRSAKNQNVSVWGVIHRMAPRCKEKLDAYENLGKGYKLADLHLNIHGGQIAVNTYRAVDIQYLTEGRPYQWYLNYVIEGAKQNRFPQQYIEQLMAIETIVDQENERRILNEKIIGQPEVLKFING